MILRRDTYIIYVQKDETYLRPYPVPVRNGLTTGDTAMLREAEAAQGP